MSKFVYHNDGKITRTDLTGIPIMSTRGVSALSAEADGNYIIMKTGDTYSFAPTTAGITAVVPQNLTNITVDNKHYLLAIDNNNNFTQLLFSNSSLNNTFTYKNNKWVLEKNGLFQQYAESQNDTVNGFALPIVNNNKETHIITPNDAQTGQYCFNVKQVGDTPTLERISIDKEDFNYTPRDSNAHIIYVDRTGNFSSIVLKDSWYSGMKYNETYKRYEFIKLSLYDQTGNTKTVNGFALPIINSSKANTQISLPLSETGDYVFNYTQGSDEPTLKKITYISDVNPNTLYNNSPPTKDSLMVVNSTGFKYITSPTTAADYVINYNGSNYSYKRVLTPSFTRYSLDTQKDYNLPASGTTKIQDIFQELIGTQIENNSLLHFKIFFYLDDTALQENNIGSFTIRRKISSTESTELCTHYIYSPVDNLVCATFTFPYSGNISSMDLVTSLATTVKILGGLKHELLVETQQRFS